MSMSKVLLRRDSICCLVMILLCTMAGIVSAQTDTIHGVINRYTRLAYIECTNNSAIQVENPSGFKAGDKILIIQMQGADVDRSNTSTFGSVTWYNNAGNYELATVDEIHGRTFVLQYELAHSYTLSGIVQVIRVPSYTNVVISDTLRPQKWNGTTGGVLAFIASGTVTMNADIDGTGTGFREGAPFGAAVIDMAAYNGLNTSKSFPFLYSCLSPSDSGSLKGEGIHRASPTYLGGKGALSNAGGGGNAFSDGSGGGGGGGNYGAGGNGGGAWTTLGGEYAGIGGYALPYSNAINRIHMGGSGGWGGLDLNNKKGPGRAGGGIILIRANQIAGNGHRIQTEGADTAFVPGGSVFVPSPYPGGGGGAGGVILLDVGSFSSTVTASAKGGRGQNVAVCDATGGGGGGGCIWLAGSSSTPTNLVIQVAGGIAGVKKGSLCTGPTLQDGYAGGDGAVLTNLQIPQGTVPR